VPLVASLLLHTAHRNLMGIGFRLGYTIARHRGGVSHRAPRA
jgi:hypothetical protein